MEPCEELVEFLHPMISGDADVLMVVDRNIARRIDLVSDIPGVTALIQGPVGAAVTGGDWRLGLGGGCRA